MENIFAEGTREKVRFLVQTDNKSVDISIEQLWDFRKNIDFLYNLEEKLQKEFDEFGKTTRRERIVKNSKKDLAELKLNIVSYIIDVFLKEDQEDILRAENKKSNEPILELILEKEKELLKSMSIEELKAMVKK